MTSKIQLAKLINVFVNMPTLRTLGHFLESLKAAIKLIKNNLQIL